jgi:rhodanese-related sulfurtransferase
LLQNNRAPYPIFAILKNNNMGLLSFLGFGSQNKNIKEHLAKGAVIIDVRSQGEFETGHVKGAKNIPLQHISSQIASIKKLNKPVIVCCASGMRSAQANGILKKNGIDSINGGGWQTVNRNV